ncbi:MAG TPA: pilin [Burkholderiaceae bacterium]
MKKNMQGFTLIELMIVIAIIAILLVIAIPAYQDYTVRARVSEGVNLAAAAKLAVSETTLDTGTLPGNNGDAGYQSPSSTYVSSITIGANGVVDVLLSNDAGLSDAGGGHLLFTPTWQTGDAQILWTCSATGITKTSQIPAQCRP